MNVRARVHVRSLPYMGRVLRMLCIADVGIIVTILASEPSHNAKVTYP